LVVRAREGVTAEARAQLACARRCGSRVVALLASREDDAPELLDLAEHEIRADLSAHGLAGDEVPILRADLGALSSASRAALGGLLDAHFPPRVQELPAPFEEQDLLAVFDQVLMGDPPHFFGILQRGALREGDRVTLLTSHRAIAAQVTVLGVPSRRRS